MGATAHAASVVYTGVVLGRGTTVEEPCIIGKPPRGEVEGSLPTYIGEDSTIRPFTTIYAGTTTGSRFQTGQGASIREGNVIGDDVSVGTNAVLEHGNRIGNRTRVHTGCFLELVTLGDDVFVGPNVVFADDRHPPCPDYEACARGAVVGDRAVIGANATVLPGVRIGEGAVVGAGSVVTHDVPAGAVAVGSPARVVDVAANLNCTLEPGRHPYAPADASVSDMHGQEVRQ